MTSTLRSTPSTSGMPATSAPNSASKPSSAADTNSRRSSSDDDASTGAGAARSPSPNGSIAAIILGSARGSSRRDMSGEPRRPGSTGELMVIPLARCLRDSRPRDGGAPTAAAPPQNCARDRIMGVEHVAAGSAVVSVAAARKRKMPGGSSPSARAFCNAVPHHSRSSSITFAATSTIGSFGRLSSNAPNTNGISTVLRNGTASVSIMMCARCSTARIPAAMPVL